MKDKNITEIQIREKCNKCDNGLIENPLWEEFFKKYPNQRDMGRMEYDKAVNDFFRNNYGVSPKDVPEEIVCDYCNGDGWIYRWVSYKV